MEELGGGGGVAPLAVLEGGHVEVQEHAEAEVDEVLLELEERGVAAEGWGGRFGGEVLEGEGGEGCGFGGELEEVSAGGHRVAGVSVVWIGYSRGRGLKANRLSCQVAAQAI